MKLINYTPHEITIGDETIPLSGEVARLTEERREVTLSGGITFTSVRVTGLNMEIPSPEKDTFWVVSRPVAEYIGLPHIVSPDRYIRDGNGNIIGCEGICWFPKGF